jgi:hypothetical protein
MELLAIDSATITVRMHWSDAVQLARACAEVHQGERCEHFDVLGMFFEAAAFAGNLHGSVAGAEAISLADFRAKLAATVPS